MPLDRLAPDQRAVVQLVLQQGRSYGDLAGLLGIPEEAVRDRAHRGIAALGDGAAPAGAGEVTDFLLGQQGVSERETTRSRLSGDPALAAWAQSVAAGLSDVSSDLPEIPAAGGAATAAAAPDVGLDPRGDVDDPLDAPATEVDAEPLGRPRPRPLRDDASTRPRPRPRREVVGPGDRDAEGAAAGRPAGSRLGGALLIGGLAILVAAILIFVVNGGDDDEPESASNGTTSEEATPTATATPQALGQIPLQAVEGQTGRGVLALFGQPGQGLVFTLAAERVPQLEEGEAYAMWLTSDNGNSQLLGFFQEPPQGRRRQLATSGPRDEDAARFAGWLGRYDRIVVSKETVNRPESPATIVLQGDLPENSGAE